MITTSKGGCGAPVRWSKYTTFVVQINPQNLGTPTKREDDQIKKKKKIPRKKVFHCSYEVSFGIALILSTTWR